MLGYLYLTAASLTVGSTVVAGKLIAAGLPPFTATALRLALALPVFLLLMRVKGERLPRPDKHDAMLLVLQAGAGSVGYTVLLMTGLQHTSAANASVVLGTLPVVSALMAVFVLGERPKPALIAALVLAAAGVLIATTRSGDASGWQGNLLVLGAVACEGLFVLLNKKLRTPLGALPLSTIMCGVGLLLAIGPALGEAHPQAGTSALAAVAYYALVPTVGGYVLWYAGSARVSGAEASLFTAVTPASAMIFAWWLLDEAIGPRQLAGIACVLAAVLSLYFTSGSGARGYAPVRQSSEPPAGPL